MLYEIDGEISGNMYSMLADDFELFPRVNGLLRTTTCSMAMQNIAIF